MNPKTKCVALYYNLHKFDWLIQPMIHMKPKACTHNIFLKIILIQSLANIYFDYIWIFTIIMCVRLQNTLFHYCNLVCVYLAYLKKECGIILYQEWNAVIEVWSFWSATLERISYEVDNCCLHFSYQQLKLFAWWGMCRVSNIEERRQDLIRTAGGHLRWINLNLLNLKEDWQEAGEKENNMYTKNIFSSSDRIYILNLFKTEFETYSYVKHYNI